MTSRFAQRFAGYLTKGDVRRLFFEVLVEKYGSIEEASRRAGIARKTIYNLGRVRDVSLRTKMKVLDAAYEAEPLRTLRFLVKVLRRRAGEALFVLLDYVKTEALRCKDPKELKQYVTFIEEVLDEVGGPLRDEVATEISDLKQVLALISVRIGTEISMELWPEYYALEPKFEVHEQGISTTLAGTYVQVEKHTMFNLTRMDRELRIEEERLSLEVW